MRHLLQGGLEALELIFFYRAAGRHGVAAKAQQHTRVALGHQVKRVAQVKTGNRAARTLEFVRAPSGCAGGEDEAGAVQFVLQACGHDADHTLVEVRVEHHQRRRRLLAGVEHVLGQQQRLLAHLAFYAFALAVDAVECARQLLGTPGVVGAQAFDAQRHVGQPAGGVQARAQGKTEVQAGSACRLARRHLEQRCHAGRHGSSAHALQTLRHQAAVVGVKLHHVGHRAQCHQRQQAVDLGLVLRREPTARAQLGAQRQQDVEHHADAGDRLALKPAAGLVRVDDDAVLWQHGSAVLQGWQVVVGDDDLQAQRARRTHAVNAGNAVVHRHQQVGTERMDALGNRSGQTVAVLDPIGHQVTHALEALGRAQQAQPAQADRAGAGAVTVVVGHDADRLLRVHRVGQCARRGVGSEQG